MGTQAVVSIVSDGQTLVKVVAGCDGYNAWGVAKELCKAKTLQLNTVYGIAGGKMGCKDCLVAMDVETEIYKGGDGTSGLYRETFNDPIFNPRWNCGSADKVVIIDVETWIPDMVCGDVKEDDEAT